MSLSVTKSLGAVVLLPTVFIRDFAPILETGEVSRPFANCQSTIPILPNQNLRFSGFVFARSPIVKMPLRFNLA